MTSSVQSNGYTSSVSVANQFGENMNIPEMIMAIQIERATTLESQIKDQMGDMQKRNEWLKEANAALAALRTARPTSDKDPAVSYGSFTKADGTTMEVHDWMTDQGISIETRGGDKAGLQSEFDAAISNLKSSIDTVNTTSQLDMVRLQGLLDKRNQAFDFLSNTLSKLGKSMDTPIGNMR
jgi:hypothetical protein